MDEVWFMRMWLGELERSQWRSAQQIASGQRRALRRLVRHARRTVPFYRSRLDCLEGDVIDEVSWRQIPVLTRSEVANHRDLLASEAVPARHGAVQSKTTSGSVGMPLTFLRTREAELRSRGLSHRGFQWHGFDMTSRMAFITVLAKRSFYPSFERHAFWTDTTRLLGIKGELVALDIGTPVDQQIAWLREVRPRYLHTVPTNARALARALGGDRIEGLEKLYLVGETISDELRAECRASLCAEIVERYGAMETGSLALQCPTGRHLHVQSENVLLEVLDSDGKPVGPGESGEVVVTTLHNYAFPLIRYRLGDIVTVGEPCACGRGLPVIEKVLGRSRQMFRFPDGTSVWPSLGQAINLLGARHWQVAQVGPLELEVRFVHDGSGRVPEFDKATVYIREQLRQDVLVSYKRVKTLPALPGGKFHDYVNELDGGVTEEVGAFT